MERIKQAIDRVKETMGPNPLQPVASTGVLKDRIESAKALPQNPIPDAQPAPNVAGLGDHFKEVNLDLVQLERQRIVAHNAADMRSRAFDMLRTQVLQSMDQKNWRFIAVTSPTEGCGKTVTAINLALSIVRQPERSALLIDMDLQRPAVANYLGIKCRHGLLSILQGRATLADALIRARVDSAELMVLPTEAATVHSSELIASRSMNLMLQQIRRAAASGLTVIFDMPPILSGDEVISVLPQVDCVLLVTATGVSTVHQIRECNNHLQSAEVVRLVLNKAPEQTHRYYY